MWFFRRKGGRKRSRSGANFSDVEGQPPSRALTDGDLARTASIKKQRTEPTQPRRARTYSFSPGRQDSIRVNQPKRRPGSNHGSRPQSSTAPQNEARQPTLHPKDRKSQRKRSSRIKREDSEREAELKAMTDLTPLRPAAESWTAGRPMKKESKRQGAAPFGRYWDNPASDVSLPLPGSIHSTMSSESDFGSYKVSAFDSLAPRPTLRYNHDPYNPGGSRNTVPTRMGSRKRPLAERVNISDEDLHSNRRKRIDELADDFDASDLRELMERDKRRRERKRQREQDRVERRLARRAEKQREVEAEARKAGTPPPENLERGVMGREMVGLGIDPASAVVTSTRQRDTSGERAPALAHNVASNPLDHFEPVGSEGQQQSTREDETEADKMSVHLPFQDDDQENATAAESREHVGALPQSSMLSELFRSKKTTSKSTLASEREKTISPQPSKQEDSPSQGTVDANGVARRFSLASFWRWTGKSRRVSQPSSFSNASREEMQAAAASSQTQLQSQANMPFGLGQAQAQARALARLQGEDLTPTSEIGSNPHYIARKSSVPKRTRSRFREDLPDFPLSPPDSRVQSPEADILPPLVEHGASSPETPAIPAPRDDTPHTNYSPIDIPRHKSSSFRGPSPEPPQSMSLASIGSEGSWLSGKTGSYRHSAICSNIARAKRHEQDNSSASPTVSAEDLGIADDEYMSRLTPRRHSGFHALEHPSGEGRPSSDEEPYNDDEDLTWGDVDARVAEVHTPIRETMRSRQAQLNTNSAEFDLEDDGASQSPSSPTIEKTNVERARSVNLGKGHVRNFSAGSARLLDIHPRHSLDGKMALQEKRRSFPLN